jgi:hypothetical protein
MFKNKIIFYFVIFGAEKKVEGKIFSPSFVAVVGSWTGDSRSRIRNG